MSAFPPSPIRSPIISPNGSISPSWAKWFSTLYQYTGSSGPANNGDIERLDTLVSDLDTRLDVAESDIDSLQAADVAIDARLDALEAAPAQVFVQDDQPAASTTPFIWVQTGLPGGGFSVWFDNGDGL